MTIRIATKKDLPAVFALRMEVFVEEQNVPPEIELDADDARAIHFIAEDHGSCLGCARVLFYEDHAHLGRIAVKKSHRGMGIGAAVCRFAISHCKQKGYAKIDLGAQCHAIGFYRKLGFVPYGEPYVEAGIDHIAMDLAD